MYADRFGEPEHPAWLVHKFLKRFRPDQCWKLTWAETYSRRCVGEHGGGFFFVTADSIEWDWAHNMVEKKRAAFEAEKKDHLPMPDAGANIEGERI